MKHLDQKTDFSPLEVAERLADLTFELLERCQEKREEIASKIGLTVAEFKALRLFGANESLSVGELAGRLELSSSRLTRILDGLVQRGLITRETATSDRRLMELRLTDEGRRVKQRLSEQYVQTHLEIISELPQGGPDSVVFALERLRDAMKSWSAKG